MPPFPAPPVIGGASGLPAYTLPPVAQAGPPGYGTPEPHRVSPAAEASPRYGAVTYGGPPAGTPGSPAAAASSTPTVWTSTHGGGAAVPQQRTAGTVYGRTGGYPAIDMTMPISSPMESSGSLTGHILAQGWNDTPATTSRSNFKVALVMLVVLSAMIGVSLLFLFTAGDAMTEMFSGLL